MNSGGSFGVCLVVVCSAMIGWSLVSGTIPASLPSFRVNREDNPSGFWAYIAFYGVGVLVGLGLVGIALLT